MIKYGSRRFGRTWEYGLEENVFVVWGGAKVDWLVCRKEDRDKLLLRLGSEAAVTEYLAGLLAGDATSEVKSVGKVMRFSDL